MTHSDYWEECVTSSLEEFGITATEEQIAGIAKDVEVGHDNIGMAFGHDVATANMHAAKDEELRSLHRQLRDAIDTKADAEKQVKCLSDNYDYRLKQIRRLQEELEVANADRR